MRSEMQLFLFVAVLLSATDKIWAGQRCCPGLGCYDDYSLFDLLPLPQCPEVMSINMKVYTRQNPKNGQSIKRNIIPSSLKAKVMTMFIVHGYQDSEEALWMHEMKNAVLAQRDYNVIIVGWKNGAKHLWYPLSASNTRTVGGEISLVTNNLIKNRKSSKALLYCVGHSLGAHVCGYAGQRVKFGRITGLDPAGPQFGNGDRAIGLSRSCADLVDVIHTDGDNLGMQRPAGHIDFYPNGGDYQPGCISELIALKKILGCSHSRAIDFFTESIRRTCFLSRYSCSSRNLFPWFCTESNKAVQSMGFNANAYSGRGIFYLKTNDKAPFCRG